MRIRIMLVLCAVLALAAAVTSATAGGPSVDPAYYQGHEVSLLIPSSASANENQFVSGCFNLGPQQNWPDPASTLYTLFVPGATGHSCPNGSFLEHPRRLARGTLPDPFHGVTLPNLRR